MNQLKKIFFPDDLEQIERFGFPCMIFIALYGLMLSIVNPQYFADVYTQKYGFLCYLQTLFIFIMLLLSIKRTYVAAFIQKEKWIVVTGLIFIATFIFGVGEKLRWGQFILEVNVPDFFREHNTQGQITIHNLKFGDFRVNRSIFGTGLAIIVVIYTIIMPLCYQKYEKFRLFIDKLGLPMARWSQVAWYALGAIIAESTPAGRKGEVLELVGCFSMLMIFAFPRNRYVYGRKD